MMLLSRDDDRIMSLLSCGQAMDVTHPVCPLRMPRELSCSPMVPRVCELCEGREWAVLSLPAQPSLPPLPRLSLARVGAWCVLGLAVADPGFKRDPGGDPLGPAHRQAVIKESAVCKCSQA